VQARAAKLLPGLTLSLENLVCVPLTMVQLLCNSYVSLPRNHRYGPEASRWEEVDERQRLSQLLTRPDYVVPGAPLLWVVACGTDYAKRFELERKR